MFSLCCDCVIRQTSLNEGCITLGNQFVCFVSAQHQSATFTVGKRSLFSDSPVFQRSLRLRSVSLKALLFGFVFHVRIQKQQPLDRPALSIQPLDAPFPCILHNNKKRNLRNHWNVNYSAGKRKKSGEVALLLLSLLSVGQL